MAEQPANTNITVKRHVRTKRSDTRYTSIKALIMNMRDLEAVVPSEEVLIDRTYDSTTYSVGTYYTNNDHHMPIVVYPVAVTTYEEVMSAGIHVTAPKIGRDRFFVKETGREDEDIHQDVRDVK